MAPTPTYIVNAVTGENEDGFPLAIQDVDKETNDELLDSFTGEKSGFVQVGPKKYFFPSGYKREASNYYNFKARPDDVFVITFPRSGTTWTQEMVWLLANKLDYERASEEPLTKRFPFLEFSCFVHQDTKSTFLKENQYDTDKCKKIENLDTPHWKTFEEKTERRFIKTHLPFSLLPPDLLETGSKVIYVARNPKDVAVSFYHLNRTYRTQGYTGDFPQFWRYFQNGLVAWAPYWEHIKEGWNRRNENNVLFLFYEDMNKDLKQTIAKVSDFLEVSYSDREISKLAEHLRIDNFKNNKSVNKSDLRDLGILLSNEESFIRTGKSGGWRSYFDDELNREADEWIQKNLRAFDHSFPAFP
ncbi:unnamed protein product [Phyllotreta striolata]|uniref:Sulfotransferase domain-containing protein n=1 Tax=Phyllotreta striolata TaxID=444603 RepID=A0A9N9TII4_PHYSR|nr:unnamed protein product [Phyllotreta striolata]